MIQFNNTNNKIFYINIMLKILLLISIIFFCLSLNKKKNKEGISLDDGCKWVPTPSPDCSFPSGINDITELYKEGSDDDEHQPCSPADKNDQDSCESCGTSPTPTPTPIIKKAQWIDYPAKCDGPSSCPGKTEDDCGSYDWTLIGGFTLGVIVAISLLYFAFGRSKQKQSESGVIMNPIPY